MNQEHVINAILKAKTKEVILSAHKIQTFY